MKKDLLAGTCYDYGSAPFLTALKTSCPDITTTFRVWRLYMAASAHMFSTGRINVYQALLLKPDGQGRSGLPLTRKDWYTPSAE